MTNFDEWEYLLTSTNIFVDVELYYALIKEDGRIIVKIKENVDGWTTEIGSYSTLNESMAAVEEYKERVEKLVKLEQDLF